jgi:hypothetical protein
MDGLMNSLVHTPTYIRLTKDMREGRITATEYLNSLQSSYLQVMDEISHPEDNLLNEEDQSLASTFSDLAISGLSDPVIMDSVHRTMGSIPDISPSIMSMMDFVLYNRAQGLEGIYNAINSYFDQVDQPHSNVHPASGEVIASIPQEATLMSEDFCFCQADREVGELYEVMTLPCGHKFDTPCITAWLQRCNTCPMCRYPLLTGIERLDGKVLEEQVRRLPDPGVD